MEKRRQEIEAAAADGKAYVQPIIEQIEDSFGRGDYDPLIRAAFWEGIESAIFQKKMEERQKRC